MYCQDNPARRAMHDGLLFFFITGQAPVTATVFSRFRPEWIVAATVPSDDV